MNQPTTRRLRNAARGMVVCLAATAGVTLLAGSARADLPTGDAPLDAALAERLALIADDLSMADATPEPVLRESAALLDLACKANPKEVRFARSLANVTLRLGDGDRALGALGTVRTLDPKDQLAMIQFVDLTANQMETGEAKLAYLQQVVAARTIAEEVRSHAAMSLVDLYFERSQDQQASDALKTALELNPQNIAALTMRLQMAQNSGVAVDRAKALAALVQASPTSAGRLLEIARECAAVGAYDDAHNYYDLGFGILVARRSMPPVDDFIDLSASELLGGKSKDISTLLTQALSVIKDDGRLYAIQLLVGQFDGQKIEDRAADIATARGVYLAQLAGVSQLLNKPEDTQMPATNPAAPMPNVVADAAKLVADDSSHLRTAYTVALAEQLWFDLYFRAAPVEDSSINALATLLGSDADPLVVRFQGWKLLSAGKLEEAKVKLGAVADRDGYAKLGLAAALAADSKPDEAKARVTELLSARPTGMLGVFAAVAAKQAGLSVEQTPDEAKVSAVFGPLRRAIYDVSQNARSAYLLSASPVNISFGPGEPLLAKVTILNNGRVPLTIGPGAMIEPRFVVDVQIRGDAPRTFPATVVGQWTGAVRLMPQQSITQTLRIDRGQAAAFFRQYPTPLFTVAATVVSNPLTAQNGSFPAPGGQQAPVGSVMERRSSPLYVEAYRNKVVDQISKGSAVERLGALELATAVIAPLEAQKGNADALAAAEQLKTAISAQRTAEQVPEVKAWAAMSQAFASTSMNDAVAAADALVSSDASFAKVAGLIIARNLPVEPRQQLAKKVLAGSPTGPLAELANGVADQVDPPPPPATAPAAEPAPNAP